MKKLSQLNAPALAGVVREKTEKSAIAEIKNCVCDGADMIDLHLSCLENTDAESLRRIFSASAVPVLALNYNKKYDWADCGFSEEERAEGFLQAIACGAAGIDMQGYTFDKASQAQFCGEDRFSFTAVYPKEVVTDEKIIAKQCAFIEKIHAMGGEVLLSCHPGVKMNCEQVVDLALFLEKRNPDIIKIVTASDCEADLAECFKAMLALKQKVKTPVSYHINGPAGKLSRIINPILGGQIAFCIDRFSESSTMEQIDLKNAADIVRKVRRL